jgi:hypothetical protein
MRRAALFGAASLGALGGCVLIYHPGDYAVGGGGTGGTASTSTTSTGRTGGGGTGGTTSATSTTSTTTGSPDPQCWNANGAESNCAGTPTWERWPALPGASGVFHAVSLEGDEHVDVAGAASGTLSIELANNNVVPYGTDAGGAYDFMARLDGAGKAESYGGSGAAGEARGVGFPSVLSGVGTRSSNAQGTLIQALIAKTPTGAAAYEIWTGQPTCKATAVGMVYGDPASPSAAIGVGMFAPESGAGEIFCAGQTSSTFSTVLGGIFIFSYDAAATTFKCGASRFYGNAAGGSTAVNAVARSGGAVFVGGTYAGVAPDLGVLPALTPAGSSAKNGFVAGFSATSLGATVAYAFEARSSAAQVTVEAVHVVADTRVYVAGEFRGSVQFDAGGFPLSSGNNGKDTDAFLVRLDHDATNKALTFAWAKAAFVGGAPGTNRRALALAGDTAANANDALYLAGTTEGELHPELDGTPASTCTGGGMYLLRIDAPADATTAPSTSWAQCFGNGTDDTDEVHLAADGTFVVLAGGRTRAIDFGKGMQAGTGVQVPFVALFKP